MADQTDPLSEVDMQFLEKLRDHPHLYERLRSLVDLADSASHTLASADQVESELLEQIRRLGATTMASWAARAEESAVGEMLGDQPTARLKKKRPSNGIACGDRSP
jgi:Lon protease-like protein